ncbi:MAG: hypothetical protein GX573_20245 [Chloroflexi bacterium]|nr:hypothetical protein [Chloroflexota bacterium]
MDRFPDYETVEYHLLYSELIKAARHRGTVTYQELALVVGLPTTGNYMGKRLGEILGAISQNEHFENRPLLSAVGVTTNGRPGGGFYRLAHELGLIDSDDPERHHEFWEDQVRACYQTWQQRFSK